MNILHIKYAVEVARLGSLSRAAESLLTAQPNISRSIKELERSLGITIFSRTAKGMRPTEDGAAFLSRARAILAEIEEVERLYRDRAPTRRRLMLTSIKSDYIARAFAEFAASPEGEAIDLIHMESEYDTVLRRAASQGLGILRYPDEENEERKVALESHEFTQELLAEFRPVLLFRADSRLAAFDSVPRNALTSETEIILSDSALAPISSPTGRQIKVSDKGNVIDILCRLPGAYTVSEPGSLDFFREHGLLTRPASLPQYRDVLIYRREHRLSAEERAFLTVLCDLRRKQLR